MLWITRKISLFLFLLDPNIEFTNLESIRYDLMLMKMSEYKFVGGENGDEEDQVTLWRSGRLGYRVSTIWRHYHSCWYRQTWLQRLVVHWNPTGPQWKSTAHRKLSTLRGVNHLTTKGSLFETTDPNPNSD